ncbi:MAG: hypothetical protein JWM27_1270 [Gemmatimonadetes bacterium]|nr:hypothetical protein [Gemmatimonadota bacterium]
MESTANPINRKRMRQALVAALGLYGVWCIRTPDAYGLLDSVDLPIHETGHLVFAPFGEFLQFAGGSLFQVLFPLCFVAYFRRRGDRFAAHVVLVWVAQNLWNVARYVGDARAQELPLVGGGEHDWAYLLGRMGWLSHDQGISQGIHAAGVLLFGYAVLMAWLDSGDPMDGKADSEVSVPAWEPAGGGDLHRDGGGEPGEAAGRWKDASSSPIAACPDRAAGTFSRVGDEHPPHPTVERT